MKKIFLSIVLLLVAFFGNAQTIKISELPTSVGNVDSLWAPVVDGGTTKKVRGYKLAQKKYFSMPFYLDGDTVKVDAADTNNDGYLTTSDWDIFNSKDTGQFEISGTGIRTKGDKSISIGATLIDSFAFMASAKPIKVFMGRIYGTSNTFPIIQIASNEQSVFIGQRSGNFTHTINSNGQNTAIGEYSLQRHTTGIGNTVFGKAAGYGIFTGNYNVIGGMNRYGGDGTGNVEIGSYAAGSLNTAGSYNITFGFGMNPLYPALDYQLTIGSNGTRWITGYNGNIGIGTTDTTSERLSVNGNLSLTTAGNKLKIATGTNASVGKTDLVAGVAVIPTTAVTANSIILITPVGAGAGSITLGGITPGVEFIINSSDGSDVRSVTWLIIN